jgi:hypothetical protein
MNRRAFPGCCTANILYDLGGTDLSQGQADDFDEPALRKFLTRELAFAEDNDCLVVMTNNEQTRANDLLEELGFKCSDWMEKKVHSHSMLRLWWKEPMG